MKKLLFTLLVLFVGLSSANASVWNLGTLTTPSATEAVDVYDNTNQTIQYTITGIGTSVTVRAESSLDGTNWFNMNDDETDTTLTANDTYIMHKPTFSTKKVRFNWVSKSPVSGGGTTPNIAIKYSGSK